MHFVRFKLELICFEYAFDDIEWKNQKQFSKTNTSIAIFGNSTYPIGSKVKYRLPETKSNIAFINLKYVNLSIFQKRGKKVSSDNYNWTYENLILNMKKHWFYFIPTLADFFRGNYLTHWGIIFYQAVRKKFIHSLIFFRTI